jgi:hypothetical protein
MAKAYEVPAPYPDSWFSEAKMPVAKKPASV